MGGSAWCRQLLSPSRRGARRQGPQGMELQGEGLDPERQRCRGLPDVLQRNALRWDYLQVGQALFLRRVSSVLFLTCNIGNATAFMERIARDWLVSVQAYREHIAADLNGENERARAYREDHEPRMGSTASERAEHELPEGYAISSPPGSP